MGGKRNLPRLSETQMALMDIVWRKGEATVTEVWKALPRGRRGARTTIMTLMARLAKKGWLRRRKVGNEYVYSPTIGRKKALGDVLSRLTEIAFSGSVESMVMSLVDARGISKEEAEHLRRIIDEFVEGRR